MDLLNLKNELSEKQQLNLVAHGDHDEIMAYIQKFSLCGLARKKLLARGNHEEIMVCIGQGLLDDVSELWLIRRGNHDEIMLYIQQEEGLCYQAEKAFIERANKEEILTYLQEHDFYDCLGGAFVKNASREFIKACIDVKPFTPAMQQALVERNSQMLLLAYIEKYSFDDVVVDTFLKQVRHLDIFEAYIKKYMLPESAEYTLVTSCSKKFVLSYFANHGLNNPEAEKHLFRCGDEEMLQQYVYMCGYDAVHKTSVCILFQRGFHELIMQFCAHGHREFSPEIWEALFLRKNDAEIETCLWHGCFDEEGEVLFVKMCSPKHIIAYKNRYGLKPQAALALLDRIYLPRAVDLRLFL